MADPRIDPLVDPKDPDPRDPKKDPLDDRGDYFKTKGVPQYFFVEEARTFTDAEIAASMITSKADMLTSQHRPALGLLKFNAMQSIPISLLDKRLWFAEQITELIKDPLWDEIEPPEDK
tara:strand:- start:1420 stop:1776 length:357 start_codon:yes stop_codon:yes gene_type:complete